MIAGRMGFFRNLLDCPACNIEPSVSQKPEKIRWPVSIAAYFAHYHRCFSNVHSIQVSQTSERVFWSKLRPCIPSTSATAVQNEMLFFNQLTEVLFERVPACAGELDHIANGDAAMFARIFDDLHL